MLKANCSLIFGTALRGLKLQAARQVPQLHDQVTKQSSHVLHLFEKKAHLVVQVGVRCLQWTGLARALGGRWG